MHRRGTTLLALALCGLGVASAAAQMPWPSPRPLPPSALRALYRPLTGPKTLLSWGYASDDAADEPETGPAATIVTDRPDFTEASSAVGLGVRQFEMGYTFYDYDNDGVAQRSMTYPELLARLGLLANWFELRLGWSMIQQTTDNGPPLPRETDVGSGDIYLGAKLWLTEQAGLLPEMSIMPQTLLPTGSEAFTNEQLLPGLAWLYGWELNEWLSIGASTQGNRSLDDSGKYYVQFAQSWTVNYQFTDRLGGYTEYFGFYPSGARDPDVKPEQYLDGGFRYLVTRDLQLDIRAGLGLTDASDDFFAGSGLSVRF